MATNKRVFTLRLSDEVFEKIGILDRMVFDNLITCLSGSKMVKNKFRRLLQQSLNSSKL